MFLAEKSSRSDWGSNPRPTATPLFITFQWYCTLLKLVWDYYFPSLHRNQSVVSRSIYKALTIHYSTREKLSGDLAGNRTHALSIMRLTLDHCTTALPKYGLQVF
jgi:hypothetical protein